MTLVRARLLSAAALAGRDVRRLARGERHARVVPRSAVEAEMRAREILAKAHQRAKETLVAAERDAAGVRLRAEAEGRADGAAALAARALALTAREAKSDELGLDRSVELARLLAERLLGEAIAVEPRHIASLARQILAQARGARRYTISGHPDDIRALSAFTAELGVSPDLIALESDTTRERGSLRIVTDIGVLDAALGPQLERLAIKLRQALSG
jgi:flagellar biosynthesis/type III secretory pathway protein FliH